MPGHLQLLCCTAATCLLGAALANEPSPANVTIATNLALKGNSFVHLQNREKKSIILEVSPGPLSSLQFASKRVTLNPGAPVDIDLGALGFQPGRQTLHIISKLFDSQNVPAGMGPFLLEVLMVSETEIRKVSYQDGFLSHRETVPNASQSESPQISLSGDYTESRPIGGLAYRTSPLGGPLAASPASQRITAGNNVDYAVAIRPFSSLNGEVHLSVIGLPPDTTASFTPNPATHISTLTVNATKSAKPGAYPLTVNGTSGNLTRSATVTLVVVR